MVDALVTTAELGYNLDETKSIGSYYDDVLWWLLHLENDVHSSWNGLDGLDVERTEIATKKGS